MSRRPRRGSSIVLPCRDEDELKLVLSNLHIGQALDPVLVHDWYYRLGEIIGLWFSEEERKQEARPVEKALLSTAKNLTEVSKLLSGHETGFRTGVEIAVASETAKYLALDPAVGSLAEAQKLVSSFQRDAARIAHVALVAYTALADQSAGRGRPALGWYDDFTALLLDMAKKGGIEPTLRKDRISGARGGWLFEAAQALESFLFPHMRSQSPEACGKRLERSRRRLRERQKSAGR